MVLPSRLEKKLTKEKLRGVLAQLIKENRDHFDLQKKLRGNARLREMAVDVLLNEGVGLWDDVIEAVISKYAANKAIVIYSRGKGRILHKTKIFRGAKKRAETYYLTGRGLYDSLNELFVDFCNANSGNNKTQPVIVATGEGGVLQHAFPAWFHDLKGFADNEITILFISGPLMIDESERRVNEYVKNLTIEKNNGNIKAEVKICRNRILSFTKLAAGFFHFYVIGDNIFAETPHVYMNRSYDPAYRLIVNDAALAKKLRDFAKKLAEVTAENLKPLKDFIV